MVSVGFQSVAIGKTRRWSEKTRWWGQKGEASVHVARQEAERARLELRMETTSKSPLLTDFCQLGLISYKSPNNAPSWEAKTRVWASTIAASLHDVHSYLILNRSTSEFK